MTSRTATLAAAAAATALVLTACGGVAGPEDTGAPGGPTAAGSVGTIVTQWAEPEYPSKVLLTAVPQGHPVLLQSDADREGFLRRAAAATSDAPTSTATPPPTTLPASTLSAIDLNTNVIVIGSYSNCNAGSSIEAGSDPNALQFRVTHGSPDVQCVWAPVTLAIWSVPRNNLGPGPFTVTSG